MDLNVFDLISETNWLAAFTGNGLWLQANVCVAVRVNSILSLAANSFPSVALSDYGIIYMWSKYHSTHLSFWRLYLIETFRWSCRTLPEAVVRFIMCSFTCCLDPWDISCNLMTQDEQRWLLLQGQKNLSVAVLNVWGKDGETIFGSAIDVWNNARIGIN